MKQSPDGVYLIDAGTKKVLEANAAFARMLGYADEETRELTSYDIVAADRKDVEQRFQEILASGEPLSFERELRRKDGSSVRVWANVSVISYGGKRVLAVMVRDMTDREKAEQALRDSEARFRAIMEQSPEGICLVAMETKCILQANEAFQRMLGYSAEEITGLSVYDFVSADREIIDRRFQETVTEGKPLSDERQYRRKDGSPIDVWVSRNIISYGGKKVMCVVVVDLTERKRTERALHDSETRYRTLMEQSPNSIFLVDMDTKGVLEANTAFHKLLGYTSEEILRLSIYDFIATERKDIRRRFQEILDAGHPMSYERQFRHKDGSLMDVWLSATVISFAGTNLALGVAIDITDRKRAETEREKLIRELQEALTNVKTLRGLLPICASCKKIRDDKGYWNQIESYVREHSEAQFTHGLCPECARRFLEDTASRKPPNHPELPSS
jgi:PAS domain S-box-containing protein